MNGPAFLRPAARRGRHGMTMIEVMIAFVIFTTVAFSLVLALNSSFDAAAERNQIEASMRGLQNRLAMLHANRLIPGETDLPDDGSGITYHLSVLNEQLTDQKKQPVPNIYRATVTASWKWNGRVEQRDTSVLVYQP